MGRARRPLKTTKETALKTAYYSSFLPSALGSESNLIRHGNLKASKDDVKKWLRAQDAYTLHRKIKRKFVRRPTIVSGAGIQYQADLIDMKKLKSTNSGYTFILTVIDVFSKYAWSYPLKSKNGKEVAHSLEKLFVATPCKYLQTDKGTEFYNREVRELLKRKGIHHFSTENDDIKASVVERFNRTIQAKLHRWFTYTNSKCWIDVIEDITKAYNSSYNRSIKTFPANVRNINSEDTWLNLYANTPSTNKKNDLAANDPVRISKFKHVFSKGYQTNWSEEVFFIDKVEQTKPTTYRIRDQKEEVVLGTYYRDELQKVALPNEFVIEDIIKMRSVGRRKQYLVKYRGYPSKFNEWINENQLV